MILQTLATLEASHGYAIAARLEQVSGGRVPLTMGNNRRARFYAITAAGRRQPGVEKQEWNRTVTIRQALLSESK